MDLKRVLREKNLGGAERILRSWLGVVFLIGSAFLEVETSIKVILFTVGIVALVSGCAGHCIVYSVLGWSSHPKDRE